MMSGISSIGSGSDFDWSDEERSQSPGSIAAVARGAIKLFGIHYIIVESIGAPLAGGELPDFSHIIDRQNSSGQGIAPSHSNLPNTVIEGALLAMAAGTEERNATSSGGSEEDELPECSHRTNRQKREEQESPLRHSILLSTAGDIVTSNHDDSFSKRSRVLESVESEDQRFWGLPWDDSSSSQSDSEAATGMAEPSEAAEAAETNDSDAASLSGYECSDED